MMEYKLVAIYPEDREETEHYYEGYQINISIYVREYSELKKKLKPILPPGFSWFIEEIKEMVEEDEDE